MSDYKKEVTLKELDASISRTKETIMLLKEVAPYNKKMNDLLMHTTGDLIVLEKIKERLRNTELKDGGE
jgi:hypothetical protein